MHKQQALKEPCELPLVSLTESDEKALFDLAVSLKFGKPQTIARSCQMFMQRYLFDFPPEVFLQRVDTFKALLDMLEGNGRSSQPTDFSVDMVALSQQCLLALLRRIRNVYTFLCSNVSKPSQLQMATQEEFQDAYIRHTYPSNRLSRWETTDPSDTSPKQLTLSARAMIGQILTKSIYCLQDTD